jgi:hypothetical protein
VACFKVLPDRDATVNTRNYSGDTPLPLPRINGRLKSSGKPEIACMLRGAGATK